MSTATLTAQEQRALAMAQELHGLLGDLFEVRGAGTPVEMAWDLMDDVIGYLEPTPPNSEGSPRMAQLRLITTGGKRS